MNKPLDLPDVTLDPRVRMTEPPAYVVTHKKTGMVCYVSVTQLNAWLLRQLRQELVSNKEKL